MSWGLLGSGGGLVGIWRKSGRGLVGVWWGSGGGSGGEFHLPQFQFRDRPLYSRGTPDTPPGSYMDHLLIPGLNPASDCMVSDEKPLVLNGFGRSEACKSDGNPRFPVGARDGIVYIHGDATRRDPNRRDHPYHPRHDPAFIALPVVPAISPTTPSTTPRQTPPQDG